MLVPGGLDRLYHQLVSSETINRPMDSPLLPFRGVQFDDPNDVS